jgi:hypothetical protein
MLTSIATIAAALTALIGLGYKLYAGAKAAKEARNIDFGRTLEKRILEATTDEERILLAKLLSDHRTK